MNEKAKPVAKIVKGPVSIAIWEQDGAYGKFYTLSASRRYRKDEEWFNSSSFNASDALLLSKAFSDAYEVIRTLKAKNKVDERSEENYL